MRKSILSIKDLSSGVTDENFNENFDFINQNYDNSFLQNKDNDYVKVKYLKGKR